MVLQSTSVAEHFYLRHLRSCAASAGGKCCTCSRATPGLCISGGGGDGPRMYSAPIPACGVAMDPWSGDTEHVIVAPALVAPAFAHAHATHMRDMEDTQGNDTYSKFLGRRGPMAFAFQHRRIVRSRTFAGLRNHRQLWCSRAQTIIARLDADTRPIQSTRMHDCIP